MIAVGDNLHTDAFGAFARYHVRPKSDVRRRQAILLTAEFGQ